MCKVIWSTEDGALVRMAGGGKCQKLGVCVVGGGEVAGGR